MANLFDFGDVKNHPRRSGFDLQRRNAFTAKAGELLPVYCRLTYPGDSFRLGIQSFTRTMPVNTAAFTRIREYFNWYWVPLRLLNKNLAPSLVKMYNQPVQAIDITSNRSIIDSLPYTSSGNLAGLFASVLSKEDGGNKERVPVNAFGFKVSACSAKLLQYFRYGLFSTFKNSTFYGLYDNNSSNNFERAIPFNLNILPLLAYQKIYNDHFRFEQWEKQVPYTYNVDFYTGGDILSSLSSDDKRVAYMSSANYFTLRYVNWNKDMFMGVMPDSQLGEVASIGSAGAPSQIFAYDSSKADKYPLDAILPNSGAPGYITGDTPLLQTSSSSLPTGVNYPIMSQSTSSQFNILQLRMAEAVQKYREVSQCADQDYRGQIKAHFGVNLSAALSDQCVYIGGHAGDINISEVVNTNLSAENEAVIQGKGVGTSQGYENFSCDEHGVLMCLYYVKPILDYVITAPWKEWTYTNVDDLPFPEFDSIGMESFPLALLSNAKSAYDTSSMPNARSTFGYVPRYIELKTDIDEINGAFRNSLRSWVTAIDPQVLSDWFTNSVYDNNQIQLNYNFFKVNPKILDSIFVRKCDSTCDSDQFLVNAVFDVKAVRNFDYDGMPY